MPVSSPRAKKRRNPSVRRDASGERRLFGLKKRDRFTLLAIFCRGDILRSTYLIKAIKASRM